MSHNCITVVLYLFFLLVHNFLDSGNWNRMGLVIFAFIIGSLCDTAYGDTTSTFEALTKEYWGWRLQDVPEFASFLKVDLYNDREESYNLQVLEDRKIKVDGYLDRLNLIDKNQLNKNTRVSYDSEIFDNFHAKCKIKVDGYLDRLNLIDKNQLNKSTRISYDVLKDTLQTYIAGYKWRFYGPMNPVNFLEGMWTDPESGAGLGKLESKKDFEDFISRINGWSQQVPAIILRLQTAINSSTTNHWVSLGTRLLEQFDKMDIEPEQFVLFKRVAETLHTVNLSAHDKENLRENAKEAVGSMLEQFRHLRTFIEKVYKKESRKEWGVNSFKDGEEYYTACLKWHLSVDMTPEEVHEKGLQEVERIYKKMIKIMERLGFHGTISEFFTKLRNDQRFIINDQDDTVRRFEQIIKERINPKLPKYFKNIPNMPVRVQKMPYDGPGGQYMSGSPDGSRPGVFQVNVIRPQDNPTYDMVALALHEAYPGHHLQEAYAQSAKGLPDFRKIVDYTKYFSVPYHFPFYTAYSEGWALYTEALGEEGELAIYQDDYELIGRYSSEIFRACRLVVDTGLHYFNLSREKAIEYMVNYTSFSRPALSIEIDRYITWPGQACAYKIGELKIWELRHLAESLLGDIFNIKDFHSVILENGAVPLSVLDVLVRNWIHETLSGNAERAFKMITDNYWQWRLREDPELATRAKSYKYNDQIQAFNYPVYQERVTQASYFLDQLMALDRTKLSQMDSVSYDILKDILVTYTEGFKWKDYGNINPFNFLEGIYTDPHGYTAKIPFDTQGDLINFVRRVELLPRQYAEKMELARLAIRLGFTLHRVSVDRIPKQLDTVMIDDPTQFAFFKPFNDSVDKFTIGQSAYVESRLKFAIQNFVSKLKELKYFVLDEYMPKTRQGLGVGHVANGLEYYKSCLKWHTSLNLSPEEVHQIGLDEVQRISKNMKAAMGRLGFPPETTIKQAFAVMSKNSTFILENGEDILNHYHEIIFDRIQPKLPKYFKKIPSLPLVVKASASDGIAGYYRSGTEDGTIPGVFYANVRRPEESQVKPTAVSSAVILKKPNLQKISYAKMSDIPNFRKYYNWKTFNVPFMFPYFNSYIEGWGLYAEYLGEEMGIYQDDYELMGRYSAEMFRACRLVIDTGIHHFNWTKEQSIDYLMKYTSRKKNSAEIEIDRYATWPGQACGYKIGEMFIKELRKHAENVLGNDFDIREFHHAILSNGAVPLDVLEKIIHNWIKSVTESRSRDLPLDQHCKPARLVSSGETLKLKAVWITYGLFVILS